MFVDPRTKQNYSLPNSPVITRGIKIIVNDECENFRHKSEIVQENREKQASLQNHPQGSMSLRS